jgi:Protein of unknown function (DUF998)
MRTTETMARVGAGAVIYLALTLAVMHAVQRELDPMTHYLSEYAYGSFGVWLQAGYVVAGLGVLLLAVSVVPRLPDSRLWSVVAAGALGLVATGLAATGLTRIDLPVGGDVATTSGTLHELAGYVAILGLIVGGFSIAAALGRAGRPALAATGRRYVWIVVAAVIATIVLQRLDLVGLGQRIFLAVAFSWLVWVGIQLGQSGARFERSTARP